MAALRKVIVFAIVAMALILPTRAYSYDADFAKTGTGQLKAFGYVVVNPVMSVEIRFSRSYDGFDATGYADYLGVLSPFELQNIVYRLGNLQKSGWEPLRLGVPNLITGIKKGNIILALIAAEDLSGMSLMYLRLK